MSASLTLCEKWIFWATNMPYFVLAACTFAASSVPTPFPTHDDSMLARTCSSSTFMGAVLLLLASVSTYWHGAQLQLMPWLYVRDHTGTARLHSLRWLKRLVVADVSCSLLTICVGLGCLGIGRTLLWICMPCGVFLWSRHLKASGHYRAYAFIHGLWHIASAVAISQIVFNSGDPLRSWVLPQAPWPFRPLSP